MAREPEQFGIELRVAPIGATGVMNSDKHGNAILPGDPDREWLVKTRGEACETLG
jgi:hypothetical protein